jgi:lipopolysaccharide biosynthesis regulator YciM
MTDLSNPYLIVLAGAAFLFLVGYILSLAVKRRKGHSPERGEQIYIKGLNYLLSNDTDKAIEEFIRVTHLEPDTIEAYLGLGHLYRSKGDFDLLVAQSSAACPSTRSSPIRCLQR